MSREYDRISSWIGKVQCPLLLQDSLHASSDTRGVKSHSMLYRVFVEFPLVVSDAKASVLQC